MRTDTCVERNPVPRRRDDEFKEIGSRLADALREAGYDQAALAVELSVSEATLRQARSEMHFLGLHVEQMRDGRLAYEAAVAGSYLANAHDCYELAVSQRHARDLYLDALTKALRCAYTALRRAA